MKISIFICQSKEPFKGESLKVSNIIIRYLQYENGYTFQKVSISISFFAYKITQANLEVQQLLSDDKKEIKRGPYNNK